MFLLIPITVKFGRIGQRFTAIYFGLLVVFSIFSASQIYLIRANSFEPKLNNDVKVITETLKDKDIVDIITNYEHIRYDIKPEIITTHYEKDYKTKTIKPKLTCQFYNILDKNSDAKYVYAFIEALYWVHDSVKDDPYLKEYLEKEQAKKTQEGVNLRSAGMKTIGNKLVSENADYSRRMYTAIKEDSKHYVKEYLDCIPKDWNHELAPKVEELRKHLK